jgi:hypothetical protein
MRRITLLVLLGLAFIVAATSGCATPAMSPPPTRIGGVVEIYRVQPQKPPALVGYASDDPAGTSVTWWLLVGTEQPPLIPGGPGVPVQWVKCGTQPLDGAQLCQMYGANLLPGSQYWRGESQPPTKCP